MQLVMGSKKKKEPKLSENDSYLQTWAVLRKVAHPFVKPDGSVKIKYKRGYTIPEITKT